MLYFVSRDAPRGPLEAIQLDELWDGDYAIYQCYAIVEALSGEEALRKGGELLNEKLPERKK